MGLTKEQAKKNISILVEKYQKVITDNRVGEYNEEATKTAFIQPLLKDVLGWDVNNFDEVSPEERISGGRVDYCLKINGKPVIFIEAKPLKADLTKHVEQVVRYGYNRKGVTFIMLTDFEGIKLFDVTIKPDIRNPNKGLKLNLFWNFYESQFDKLWQLSKESVASGILDKMLSAKPKDRLPVDKAILDDLKQWREVLAKDIYKNNNSLFSSKELEKDADYLKVITQRILDRIIFIRFCEDRKFVKGETLQELFYERTSSFGFNIMGLLKEKFQIYNDIFNSDLFKSKDWEKDIYIDFRVMNKIVMDTYNPYQFDVIPLEVLGNIYEQYLGYTIRLTPQIVKYELKPEVRKAGGVYYTPEYIVDYIVKNTVGKILSSLSLRASAKQSPTKRIQKLRILDPACGSGSFLIRAYEEMLNYYQEQKKKLKPQVNTDKHGSSLSLRAERGNLQQESIPKESNLKYSDSEIRLTLQEKRDILKEHIFGVDIDEQAVEVTKLSLMLRMLKDEQEDISGSKILPMLDENIKCGNSLISGSPIELKKYFGDDYYKVKPFNWEEEFKEVFADGGFDVVIGNPPYVTADIKDNERKYYIINYPDSTVGKLNTYRLFTHKGLNVLKTNGLLGFIIPNTYLTDRDSQKLRELLLNNSKLKQIIFFPENLKVFENVTQATTIIIFHKTKVDLNKNIVNIIDPVTNTDSLECGNINKKYSQELFLRAPDNMIITKRTAEQINILEKIINNHTSFDKCVDIYQGEVNVSLNKDIISTSKKNRNFQPLIRGNNIRRYYIDLSFTDNKGSWVDALKPFRNHQDFGRIVTQEVSNMQTKRRLNGVYIDKGIYVGHTANYMIIRDNKYNPNYFVALLNSYLLDFIFQSFNSTNHIPARELKRLPFRKIDFTIQSDKKLHDQLVELVDVMLDLNKKIQSAKGSAKEQIQREITKTDNAIDNIVYKLYGITEEEKKIIEGM